MNFICLCLQNLGLTWKSNILNFDKFHLVRMLLIPLVCWFMTWLEWEKSFFFNFCVNRNRDSVSYQNNRCGHILYCEKPFLVYEKAKIMYNGIILHVYIQVFIFTLINFSNKYPFSDAYNILAQCSNHLWQFFKFCLRLYLLN